MSNGRNIELARDIIAALDDGLSIAEIYPLGRELTEGVTMRIDAGEMVDSTKMLDKSWLQFGEMIIETSYPDVDRRHVAYVPDCDWRRFSADEIDELRDLIRASLRAWLRKWEAERENETEQTRRGRLPKAESDAKRTRLMAELVNHPTLIDDPASAAALVAVSESQARRWIDQFRQQYRNK